MPEGLLGAIREFAGAIVNPFDVDELLQRLTERTLEVVDASGCGIMLQDEEGQFAFAAASDDVLVEVELHQEHVNEGACYEAFQRNELVVVEDVGVGRERWPGYRDRVLAVGLRAVMGVPMNAFGRTIGVMNVYRSSPGPWTSDDVEAAEILTAIGAGYLVHAHDLRAQHELAEHLQEAIAAAMDRDGIGDEGPLARSTTHRVQALLAACACSVPSMEDRPRLPGVRPGHRSEVIGGGTTSRSNPALQRRPTSDLRGGWAVPHRP